jgi:hypothetical protein
MLCGHAGERQAGENDSFTWTQKQVMLCGQAVERQAGKTSTAQKLQAIKRYARKDEN